MHYFRFCARSDLTREHWDNAQTPEEFPDRVIKSAGDIFLVAKKWLADTEVLQLVALVPEATARDLRVGMSPPHGLAARRPIATAVAKNLAKQVPSCKKAGEISQHAADYLLQWASSTLPRVPKPAGYPFLTYRWDPALRREGLSPGQWVGGPRSV